MGEQGAVAEQAEAVEVVGRAAFVGGDALGDLGLGLGEVDLDRDVALGRELGIDNLWVKDDSTNPTNSFKDRVVACALSATATSSW